MPNKKHPPGRFVTAPPKKEKKKVPARFVSHYLVANTHDFYVVFQIENNKLVPVDVFPEPQSQRLGGYIKLPIIGSIHVTTAQFKVFMGKLKSHIKKKISTHL